MNPLLHARRLKPRQRRAPSPPAWALPTPPTGRLGEAPQGDLVPFVAANLFVGFGSGSLVGGPIPSGAVSKGARLVPTSWAKPCCHRSEMLLGRCSDRLLMATVAA
jgi:hypothetical protein